MTVKENVVTEPNMSKQAQINMERCATFLARMIEKYGREVLAEIEVEEQEKEQKKKAENYASVIC